MRVRTKDRHAPSPIFVLFLLILAFAAVAPQRAAAESGTRIPNSVAPIPDTKIACMTKGTRRYLAKTKPGKCEFGGLVEDSYNFYSGKWKRLGREGTFARFPVGGLVFGWEPITWLGWGEFAERGLGSNVRNGDDLNISVYRRVRCADGSAWYSAADLTDSETAVAFYLRLPVCGNRIPPGSLGTVLS